MRICFLLKIRQEMVEEYKMHHTQVWPEMQDALRATSDHELNEAVQRDVASDR